jgi:hypothetical protein
MSKYAPHLVLESILRKITLQLEVKRRLRAGLRTIKHWLSEEPSVQHEEPVGPCDNHYRWLRAAFRHIYSADPACRRPAYLWGVLEGVGLAKVLGFPRVSVVEFGVAGGNGLLALERVAAQVEKMVGVAIDVYGFDTGIGLPASKDYRDVPYLWNEGYFPMDKGQLTKRLQRAQLKLGLVESTLPEFLGSPFAPVAFISFDLDLYTGTQHALKLLEASSDRLLPRVSCYFDDIMGYGYNDHTGERLAMAEFNAQHALRKVSLNYGLKWFVPPQNQHDIWVETMYLAHIFEHPLYGAPAHLNRPNLVDLSGTFRG